MLDLMNLSLCTGRDFCSVHIVLTDREITVNDTAIKLLDDWCVQDEIAVQKMFENYSHKQKKNTYFEKVLLPPFLNAFLLGIAKNKWIPTPLEFLEVYQQICTIPADGGFKLKPSCDYKRGERKGVLLPPRPDIFKTEELLQRISRCYAAFFRECYLLHQLSVRNPEWVVFKDNQADIHDHEDLNVNGIKLALFDGTHRATQLRADKSKPSSTELELSISFEKVAANKLALYSDKTISLVEKRIARAQEANLD